MSRWCTLTSLLLLGVVAPATSWAQMAPPQAYPDGTSGVVPAGWRSQAGYADPGYSRKAPVYGYGQAPIPQGPGRTIYEQLPDDQGWLYEDAPIDRILKSAFRHAYFRADYLLWDISDPGDDVLGAPTNLTVPNPNSQVPIPANQVPVLQLTDQDGNLIEAVQPTLANVFTNENNGLRLTFGMPLAELGTFEASVFALQTSRSTLGFPDIRSVDVDGDGITDFDGFTPIDTNGDGIDDDFISQNVVDAVAQAVLVNGQVPAGNNFVLINDVDYQATLKTSVWGAEGNFLFAPYNPNQDFVTTPMVGVRYMNFNEELRQSGSYTSQVIDPVTGLPVLDVNGNPVTQVSNRRIDATTKNHLVGPQFGFRTELRRKWFAVGATPKVMLGVNNYRAELGTVQVLNPNDPSQSLLDKGTTFGVIGDIEVYSRVYLGEHFSAFVGYNFLWAGMITRPADDIVYNIQSAAAGQPAQSAFDLDIGYSGAILQGLSIGGQIEY